MSKHTPGPWEVSGEWLYMPAETGHHSNFAQLAMHWPSAEANARLIAAAPDLLSQHEDDMEDLRLLMAAINAGDPYPELRARVEDMMRHKTKTMRRATGGEP